MSMYVHVKIYIYIQLYMVHASYVDFGFEFVCSTEEKLIIHVVVHN